MSGLVTKTNFREVWKTYGLTAAIRFMLSREKTFLSFLIKNRMI